MRYPPPLPNHGKKQLQNSLVFVFRDLCATCQSCVHTTQLPTHPSSGDGARGQGRSSLGKLHSAARGEQNLGIPELAGNSPTDQIFSRKNQYFNTESDDQILMENCQILCFGDLEGSTRCPLKTLHFPVAQRFRSPWQTMLIPGSLWALGFLAPSTNFCTQTSTLSSTGQSWENPVLGLCWNPG